MFPPDHFQTPSQVYTVPEHADEVEAVYKQTTAHAEVEEGTVYYCISRDSKDPSVFHFFERYKSKAAFDAHNDQDIIKKLLASGWMKDVKAVFAKPIEG
jgi:quinol monooxygenase YgiN